MAWLAIEIRDFSKVDIRPQRAEISKFTAGLSSRKNTTKFSNWLVVLAT